MTDVEPPIPTAVVMEKEPAWAAELDEAILAGTLDSFPAPARAWQPATLEDAEWCMTRLRVLLDRVAEVEHRTRAWADRLARWRDAELRRVQPGVEYFDSRLREYALRARANDPKRKTVFLPSGDVKTQAPSKPVVSVMDEEALLEWLREEVPADTFEAVVQTSEHVKVVDIRKLVSAQKRLLPSCALCGDELGPDGKHAGDDEPCPNDPDGIHSVGCGCDRPDHEPVPIDAFDVYLGEKPVPGMIAVIGQVTAKAVPAR